MKCWHALSILLFASNLFADNRMGISGRCKWTDFKISDSCKDGIKGVPTPGVSTSNPKNVRLQVTSVCSAGTLQHMSLKKSDLLLELNGKEVHKPGDLFEAYKNA